MLKLFSKAYDNSRISNNLGSITETIHFPCIAQMDYGNERQAFILLYLEMIFFLSKVY
jgi:hypothetical protein